MKNLIKIENDALFICERLKEIDKSYYVVFDFKTQKYQVHSSHQKFNSFCFVVPFSCLDERTILYARKTRIENRDKIIKEIEMQNLQCEKQNLKNQVKNLKEALCL